MIEHRLYSSIRDSFYNFRLFFLSTGTQSAEEDGGGDEEDDEGRGEDGVEIVEGHHEVRTVVLVLSARAVRGAVTPELGVDAGREGEAQEGAGDVGEEGQAGAR